MAVIAAVVAASLQAVSGEYGYHRDELYFIVAGQHPDWGYPDQPPFSPLLAAAMAIGLAGCGSVVENLVAEPPDLFTLTPKTTFADGLPKVSWQLVVEEPTASGGINTTRIALRTHPTELT